MIFNKINHAICFNAIFKKIQFNFFHFLKDTEWY
jgi:hypothetical protein